MRAAGFANARAPRLCIRAACARGLDVSTGSAAASATVFRGIERDAADDALPRPNRPPIMKSAARGRAKYCSPSPPFRDREGTPTPATISGRHSHFSRGRHGQRTKKFLDFCGNHHGGPSR
jgi:hypothetical protein